MIAAFLSMTPSPGTETVRSASTASDLHWRRLGHQALLRQSRCNARYLLVGSIQQAPAWCRPTTRLLHIFGGRDPEGSSADYAAQIVTGYCRYPTHSPSDGRFLLVFVAVPRLGRQRWCHF